MRVFQVILLNFGGLMKKKRYTEEQVFRILKEGESCSSIPEFSSVRLKYS